jgi:hypothetical protein
MELKISLLKLVFFGAITLTPYCTAGGDMKKSASTGNLAALLAAHKAKQEPTAQPKPFEAKPVVHQAPQPQHPEDDSQKLEFLKTFCFSTGDLISFAAETALKNIE